jgi:hypothetical protein
MTYLEYYHTQSGNDRFRLNELSIWAVNKMEDTGANIVGCAAHLGDRQDQLVSDIKFHGWSRASNRFRVSVLGWVDRYKESTGPLRNEDKLTVGL